MRPLTILFARFIPACVGNARWSGAARPYVPVHPRVCGERYALIAAYLTKAGSSPRVWGTLLTYEAFGLGRRFIPACVGNACIWH